MQLRVYVSGDSEEVTQTHFGEGSCRKFRCDLRERGEQSGLRIDKIWVDFLRSKRSSLEPSAFLYSEEKL